ncbi:MAG: asparagine synthase (glutamine-hydrolyzing) [Elusimicrobia bacterium GWA2_62_23]|nr:MAG: asparagine synthase (glutamine-hydrolyzing) [Elusimicrobia bacterium GWA2_62_23]
MCGIVGIYNYGSGLPVTREALKAMNDLIVHRGPDDEGYFTHENVGLAMRRLSIIDISTGHQPISNEDDSLYIVFNGEIYNFQELRQGLLARGHKFKTKSDTEVILHLYEEKGEDFPKELRGMFAVAIWDKRKKRLTLARDRMGKKPLYYAVTPSFIAFASELRALLAVPGLPRDIDLKAVDTYLTLQYIPSPMSVFKAARKLEPASTLVFEDGKLETKKYWNLPLGERKLDGTPVEELKERLRAELAEAVKIRLISEVPLGAFLSGGIDSSVIVALMAKASAEPVKTFSIGFKEAEFSELGYARQVAEMYGTKHTEFLVEANMASVLEKLAWHYSEPYADSSALPSYFVSRETRKEVTVALNGDGGDENFGGYIRYQAMKVAGYFTAMPDWAKKAALGAMEPFPEKTAPFNTVWRLRKFLQAVSQRDLAMTYLSTVSYFKTDEKERLLSPAFVNALGRDINYPERYISKLFNEGQGSLTEKIMYTDLRSYLPECLMTKMDIASMANSLETRSPILDHKVVEFAHLLPDNMKLRGFTGTKWILKEAFKDMLPRRIYKRGKMGFGIPLGPWFRGELKDYWAGACLSQKALDRNYFKREELYRLWDEHQRGARDHGYRLWALLMLELWHRQFAPDFKL